MIRQSFTPQATIFGLTNEVNKSYNLRNQVLFVFKYCLLVKRGAHTQYRYFNRKPNRNTEKNKTNKSF